MNKIFGAKILILVVLSGLIVTLSPNTATSQGEQKDRSFKQEGLLTWEAMSEFLRTTECDLTSFKTVENCKDFARVLSLDSKDIFLEMASKRKRPLVSLFGFFAIKKRFPEDAAAVALDMLAHASQPELLVHASLYIELSNVKNAIVIHRLLDDLATMPWFPGINLSFIMDRLQRDAVYDWFHSPNRAACSTTFEATVFETIMGGKFNKLRPLSQLLKNRLRHYATVPGSPRLTYLHYATRSEEGYVSVLASVLEDPSLDVKRDLLFLISDHDDFIEKNINISALNITPERKTSIKEMIELRRSNNQSQPEVPKNTNAPK